MDRHTYHDVGRSPHDGDEPGLKQAELREAAHEGPHGSHADTRKSPVEEHDPAEHAHEAADHAAAPHDEHAGHEGHGGHAGHGGGHSHHEHHAMMVTDFRQRFFVSLALTVPILALSPMIQGWLGFELAFPGSLWVLAGLSALVYGYGGWPFLTGMVEELKGKRPGMMTLVAMAISVAFFFEIETYPTMTFTSTGVQPTGQNTFRLTGDLTIKGTTKEVTFDVEAAGPIPIEEGQRVGFHATTEIDRRDFGITWGSELPGGIPAVGHQVQLVLDVEAVTEA